MNDYTEQGVVFQCGENRLVGIAAAPGKNADVGILILVGGPQYRVGSHRQFTLLARALAEAGFPSFRFDYTGMGDSEGGSRAFDKVEEDISAAIEAFLKVVPGISRVILWGLCDGASTAMMFAHRQPSVVGMILLNPWVHEGEYSPEVKLSHFYRPLLREWGHWRRLLSGKINIFSALKELTSDALALIWQRTFGKISQPSRGSYVQDMLDGLRCFQYDILIILSENDLTAREFSTLIENEKHWKEALQKPGIRINTILGADHTFSQSSCQEQVSQMTIDWVRR